LSLNIAERSAFSWALVVSFGTLAIKALILVSSVERRAWSVAEALALSDVAAVTSAEMCPSCVKRLANWTSSAFCAVMKLVGTVVVVVVSAYANVEMLIPIAATSASTAKDREVACFMVLLSKEQSPK
jgi:hypothetical protein